MAEFEPLYTADEMRVAEARYPGYPGSAPELMERAGAQAARVAQAEFGDAVRWAFVCGGGSNGGEQSWGATILSAFIALSPTSNALK